MLNKEEVEVIEQMCDVSLKTGGIANLAGTLLVLKAMEREKKLIDLTPVKEEPPTKP